MSYEGLGRVRVIEWVEPVNGRIRYRSRSVADGYCALFAEMEYPWNCAAPLFLSTTVRVLDRARAD